MEKQNVYISAKDLAEEVMVIVKEEMVATYRLEGNILKMHFRNGQRFHIIVEECK